MATAKKSKPNSNPPASIQNFPIVGIGASAGGLDAFKRLLSSIPENSGMAYVLVQHLDPSHESILPEILQRVTKIPVFEITDDIHLAPDHIYIIPSNKILTSTDGVLQLTPRDKKILNLSVDIFFTSLADVHKEFAVGVVLSGTGSDGTLGLKAIKAHGGISIAQDEESAAYDGMPQSAILAGVVDFILAPEKIPERLLHINSTFRDAHIFKQEDEEVPKDDEAIFKQIISLLRQRSGVDFTFYKQPTIRRRIARRIAITKQSNLASYLKAFRTDRAEQDALFQDILIPVTSFFRDPKTFQFLENTIMPSLFKNKAKEEPLRIWIAGCSSGEEAYSLAITIHEYINAHKKEGLNIQLFASDISEKAIFTARKGIYSKAEVEKLSQERIKNYFIKKNDGYEINKIIRDMCVFAPHNFLKDPPFAKMDLISCRNVLIYMDSFLQKKALNTFHYALKENGVLMLGKSESTSNVSELFSPVDTHEKIYFRKPLPGRFMHISMESKEEALRIKSQTVSKTEATQTDFRKSAEDILLSKYTPASVVVNEQMDIVHFHGTITPFLEQPQGKPTFNLLKMANEGLAFELRNAIHKVKLREVAITKENISIIIKGKQFLVNIEIVPLTDTVDLHYLILFTKTAVPVVEEKKRATSRKVSDTLKQVEQLEKLLAHTREDMRSVTEDMEATNEELQSANEELQSSNEEMQSLNEEMETSKEELQSTNEELIIVNQELMDKQEQLNAARLYSDSIVSTIRHPLIVLDRSLRIKTANDAFYKEFKTTETETMGKLLYEIQHNQWDDNQMRALLENILPKKETIVDLELIIKFPFIGLRHILINARQIKNEKTAEHLILLAIDDITEKSLAEEHIKQSEEMFKSIFENSLAAVIVADDRGNYLSVNKAASELLEYSINELLQMNVGSLKMIEQPGAANRFEEYIRKGLETGEFVFITKNGTTKYAQYHATRIRADFNLSILMDITELKETEEKLKESEKRFRNILESAPDGIVVIDHNKIIQMVNVQTEKLFGFSREEMINKELRILIPDRFHKSHSEYENQFIAEPKPRSMGVGKELIGKRKDGSEFSIEVSLSPLYQGKNKETILATIRDITEQKRSSKDLKEAKDKAINAAEIAEKALSAKQQFLSNMSHEIRTPMNAIVGFTKVLMKTDLIEKQKEYLQAIKSSGETLIVLIDDILDLAKVDAGKMVFINSPFKMYHSIITILNLFETKIQEKNLELVKEYDSRIPEILLGDSIRLNQILINLVSNAVKFTSKGTISICVNLMYEDEEKVTLEIKVSDTGIGIPENKIESIFETFEQATHITSSLYGGTGLGLAIVKQLVEKQGGTITVKSKLNEGSTFGFTLNFEKTIAEVSLENGFGQYETKNYPVKVLVVEDVKLNQLLMRTLLDDFKFAWDIADNGQIAIEKLQTNAYDIILMDLQMPIMNGFEATAHIRNIMKLQIPIIALTADVTTMDSEKCKAEGMNDYISKPLNEKLLYNKILDLIKSK